MIQPVSVSSPKVFKIKSDCHYENHVGRSTEQKLAILNSGGISAAIGAFITMCARCYTSSWTKAASFGVGAAGASMLFITPKFLYKAGINSDTKFKETDTFTKEKIFEN